MNAFYDKDQGFNRIKNVGLKKNLISLKLFDGAFLQFRINYWIVKTALALSNEILTVFKFALNVAKTIGLLQLLLINIGEK